MCRVVHRADSALQAADKLLYAKEVVSQVVGRHGLAVSWLPKPMAGHAGSGCHVHFSLWRVRLAEGFGGWCGFAATTTGHAFSMLTWLVWPHLQILCLTELWSASACILSSTNAPSVGCSNHQSKPDMSTSTTSCGFSRNPALVNYKVWHTSEQECHGNPLTLCCVMLCPLAASGW
mgnify:CR=1 FL=1